MKREIAAVLATVLVITASGCSLVYTKENEKTGTIKTTTNTTLQEQEETVTTTVFLNGEAPTVSMPTESHTDAKETTTKLPAQTKTATKSSATTGSNTSTVSSPKSSAAATTTTTTTTAKPTTVLTATQTTKSTTTTTTKAATTSTVKSATAATTQATDATTLAYRKRVWELVNEERAKAGLAPLEYRADIQSLADIRAEEIDTFFSHDRPDGSSCFTVFEEAKVVYRTVGENLAKGQQTPERVVEAWMNSEGHRANILDQDFTGIVVAYGENRCWVQLFIGDYR